MITRMTLEQHKRFLEFIFMDDFQFYEEYIADLPEDAQERFFEETPDFFADYISQPGEINLEEDKIYQRIKTILSEKDDA